MGKRAFGALLLMSMAAVAWPQKPPIDLTEMKLEDLMNIEVASVYGASKHLQKVTEAPASVTIVTSEEIQKYGYRTLADILRSARAQRLIGTRHRRRGSPGDRDRPLEAGPGGAGPAGGRVGYSEGGMRANHRQFSLLGRAAPGPCAPASATCLPFGKGLPHKVVGQKKTALFDVLARYPGKARHGPAGIPRGTPARAPETAHSV
jgi:hypothetical protein